MKKSENVPLASILILAYRSERFIRDAIDSALAQTWPNFEVVVLVNGDVDKTDEIVRSYADPRLRHMYEKENLGIVAGRNRLLVEARGEFLTWLDSDDSYLPKKVEREVEYLIAHPDDAGVYCDTYYFFDGKPGAWFRNVNPRPAGNLFEPMLDRILINNTAFMMRRAVYEKLGGFNPSTGIVEDWEYFLRMAHHRMRFGYIDERLLKCRLREDSASRFEEKPRSKESIVAIFENLRGQMSEDECLRYRMDDRVRRRYRELALAYLGAKQKKEAVRAFRKASSSGFFRFLTECFCVIVSIVPASWLSGGIKFAARIKKRGNYEPVLFSGDDA